MITVRNCIIYASYRGNAFFLCLRNRQRRCISEVELHVHALLTSTFDGSEWSALNFGCFTPGGGGRAPLPIGWPQSQSRHWDREEKNPYLCRELNPGFTATNQSLYSLTMKYRSRKVIVLHEDVTRLYAGGKWLLRVETSRVTS